MGKEVGKIHVISADFQVEVENGTKYDVGQVPNWLDWDEINGDDVKWHFHSEIFRLPEGLDGVLPRVEEEEEWRKESLPSFNSFAIEERAAFVEGLSEEL